MNVDDINGDPGFTSIELARTIVRFAAAFPGHAPKRRAKCALSGEACDDRVGEDGDVGGFGSSMSLVHQ
jgi:hypothetical protein